jgi:hypothetical protein
MFQYQTIPSTRRQRHPMRLDVVGKKLASSFSLYELDDEVDES